MKIKFRNSEDVYQFLRHGGDAWGMPIIEDFVGMCDPEEDLDVTELNQWLETEYRSLTKGYEDFLDND